MPVFKPDTPEARRRKNMASHDLIKTGDPEVVCMDNHWPAYCDGNGEVVLGFCRRCNGGEVELEEQSCLERLLIRAMLLEKTLSPLQRAINLMKQRQSWVVGESRMNDDGSPNGRTREEAVKLLETVAPEFLVLAEMERLRGCLKSEIEARGKLEAALRSKEAAMDVLFERMRLRGVPYEDLIP